MKPPAYVLPPGFSADSLAGPPTADDVPKAGSILWATDHAFPLVPRVHWERIYAALGHGTEKVPLTAKPNIQELNTLTRAARDEQPSADRRVTRTEVEYVAKALLFADSLAQNMSPQEIAHIFTQWTLKRLEATGLDEDAISEIGPWLNPY